jgi:hypothetical protein
MATNDNSGAAPAAEEELDDELEDEDEDEGEGNDEKKDEGKAKRQPETPEARKARLERELARHQKKHPDLYKSKDDAKEAKPAAEKEPNKPDYGQKAYLAANDIKDPAEQKLAFDIVKETGKELEDVITGNYFKAELKALREEKAAEDATPSSRRSRANTPSSAEYWLDRKELPADRKLATEVVNLRIARDKKASQFTDNPVGNVSRQR